MCEENNRKDRIEMTAAEKLQKLSMLMHRLNRPMPVPHGPRGRGQERALNQIALRDGLTQTELMERLGVQRSTMSEMVDKLERTGLIERRPGLEDRRQVHLHISESGRQHLERLNADENHFDPFEILSSEELESLTGILDRLISFAEEECARRGLPVRPARPFPGEPPFGMPGAPFGHGGFRPSEPPFPPEGFGRHRRPPFEDMEKPRPVYLADEEDRFDV